MSTEPGKWIAVMPILKKELCLRGISSNLCSSILKRDCDCKLYEDSVKSQLTQDHGEVIGFHEKWIHPDFNPNGIRIGFLNGDDKFYSAQWWDYQDTYQNSDEYFPTHWMPLPQPPPKPQ